MSDNESNESRETVADIVALVRRVAQHYEDEAAKFEGLLRESLKLSADNYRIIADRIEAAARRAYNEIDRAVRESNRLMHEPRSWEECVARAIKAKENSDELY